MKTLTIDFPESDGINERIKALETDPDELIGVEIKSSTLVAQGIPDINYSGYDTILKKMLLVHATSLVIEYE
ncbi:MAG: hypothetical protein JKX73_09315 [Flavobacteriales bacterium]|nr:hypothetical protein [Flavobacteriales bacterium]